MKKTELEQQLLEANSSNTQLEGKLEAAIESLHGKQEQYSSTELKSAKNKIAKMEQSNEDLADRLRRQQDESDRLRDVIKARDAELLQRSDNDASSVVAVAESQSKQYSAVRHCAASTGKGVVREASCHAAERTYPTGATN